MATNATAAPAKQGWALPLAVLISGMFMSVLDVSIVNVAIPTMQNDFGVTTDEIQWVSTAYSLSLGVVVPVTSWLSAKFGLSRLYLVSLVGFAAGSALCGLAWNLWSMVAFRIVQAIPGGILPVVTQTMLLRIVPREKMGAAMGMFGLGIVVAPAIGPTLGGYLVEYVDWRLIFFINVPVGILGTVAAMMLLPRFAPTGAGRFDVMGFLAIATGLFSLLLALTEGSSWGWTSYRVLILLTVSVLALALFVIIELEVDNPLLDVRVFRSWPFTNSLLLISVLRIGLFGVLFYIPLFLQLAQGLGAFETGLVLFPQALVMAVSMPLAGRIYDKIGPRWPAVIGLTILTIGTYDLHVATLDMTRGHLIGVLMFRALGMGMSMMPIMTGGISAIPPTLVAHGSAFNNVVQRSVAALGVAVLTAILTSSQAQMLADRTAMLASNPHLAQAGGPGVQGRAIAMFGVYQQTNLQAFVAALDELFVITAWLTAIGIGLALLLRNGPLPAGPGHGPGAPGAGAPAAPGKAATNGASPEQPATAATPTAEPTEPITEPIEPVDGRSPALT